MSYEPSSPAGGGRAAEMTNLPGIFLLIVGILNVLGAIYFIISGFQGMSQSKQVQIQTEMKGLTPEQKKQMEEMEKAGWSPEKIVQTSAGSVIAVGFLALLASIVTILAGIKMRALQSYGLAVAGSVLAIIPCISPAGCCLVGEGIGIWALVVLLNSDVKSAFR